MRQLSVAVYGFRSLPLQGPTVHVLPGAIWWYVYILPGRWRLYRYILHNVWSTTVHRPIALDMSPLTASYSILIKLPAGNSTRWQQKWLDVELPRLTVTLLCVCVYFLYYLCQGMCVLQGVAGLPMHCGPLHCLTVLLASCWVAMETPSFLGG